MYSPSFLDELISAKLIAVERFQFSILNIQTLTEREKQKKRFPEPGWMRSYVYVVLCSYSHAPFILRFFLAINICIKTNSNLHSNDISEFLIQF